MYSLSTVINPDVEIPRLREIMPATGRMNTRLVSRPKQTRVVITEFPKPWKQTHPISINFDLWGQLSRPQRDLMLLRQVSWLNSVKILKPDLYQGLTAAGLIGVLFELVQFDVIGVLTAGGLSTIAGAQIWRASRGPRPEMEADETAIRVAQRRGYSETEAAQHLLSAIEAIPRIEGRGSLTFTELIRAQNLRAIAGLSLTEVPGSVRRRD